MSGIDIIGGQIYPQGEDAVRFFYLRIKPTDTEFYHYALAKLGFITRGSQSNMKGRTMCELFGNYTWSEGVRLGIICWIIAWSGASTVLCRTHSVVKRTPIQIAHTFMQME